MARWLFPSPKSRWEIERKGGDLSSSPCEGDMIRIPFSGFFLGLKIVTMLVSEIKLVSELRNFSMICLQQQGEGGTERGKKVKRKLIVTRMIEAERRY